MKIKVILLTITGIVLLLGSIVTVLYLLAKPQWNILYEYEEYSYLTENLYPKDDKYVGTIWVDYIEIDENYLHIHPVYSDVDIQLESSKIEETEDSLSDIVKSEPYPMYLSITFSYEDKNMLEKLQCNYLKKACTRVATVDSWRVYSITYPYPELSEEESKELIDRNMQYYLQNDIYDWHDNSYGNLLAEYVYNEKIGIDRGHIVQELKGIVWTDVKELITYSTFIDSSDPLYPIIKDKICEDIKSTDYSTLPVSFTEMDVSTMSGMCGASISNIKAVDSEYKLEYKNIDNNLLMLLRDNDLVLQDERVEMEMLLTTILFNASSSPLCSIADVNEYVLCTPELVYLTKLFLME